jgi:putative nucleotidyltransferase with HDIG domain
MITREEALGLLSLHIKNEAMIRHSLASEAVMKSIANYLGEDIEIWGFAGLLHDLDVEVTHADAKTHGTITPSMLQPFNVPSEMVDAIVMHNEDAAPRLRQTVFEHALAAGETITGLIMATTYVYPDRKIASVKTKSVVKRMKEKNFAASVKRENILECELIGIPIDQFAELAISAMKEIASELGV